MTNIKWYITKKICHDADYGLDKLATAGTRLKSVLLYHIHPSGSLTLGQLSAAGNLTTVLGQDLNANYPLQASTNTTNGVSSHSNCLALHFPINFLLSPLCSVQGLPRSLVSVSIGHLQGFTRSKQSMPSEFPSM